MCCRSMLSEKGHWSPVRLPSLPALILLVAFLRVTESFLFLSTSTIPIRRHHHHLKHRYHWNHAAARLRHTVSVVCAKSASHDDEYSLDTRIIKGGEGNWSTDPMGKSTVNPPIFHASTVTYPTVQAMRETASDYPFRGLSYGRHGTPTSWALEEAFASLEGGYKACAVASGVAAINAAMLAFLSSGDHVLVSDGVYDPTRQFTDSFLSRFGVEATYFDPLENAEGLKKLMKANTKVVFLESPTSLSFELHDFPALAGVAKAAGTFVVVDNTWGPSIFRPLEMGADVSINAATKYIGGHSDLMMGLIACTEATYRQVKMSVKTLGCPAGPDDCYLALRGLRTLSVRMKRHEASGLRVARWLQERPEVIRVMHPGLQTHPQYDEFQHQLFKRDFLGACGLFSFQLRGMYTQEHVARFCDTLKLFAIGYSWGGYESLVVPVNISDVRSVRKWDYGGEYGPTIRLHVGLEDCQDLIDDLDAGFKAME